MISRDPLESHRTSTPLELLFDLTFVVAFSQAADQTAHLLELGHIGPALMGFAFATFAVSWAWINYSWLASAYDTQDIFFRIATLVAMVGVLLIALGLTPAFRSIDEGRHLDNIVMVAGYVIIRIATVAVWLRAAAHDPAHRRTCLAYAIWVSAAQVGWVVLVVVDPPLFATFSIAALLVAVELIGPLYAETKYGRTPWHAHHIAERYGLLVIISLGEVVLGTILTISAVVDEDGWSIEAGVLAVSGTILAFGMWWAYFTLPSGVMLARHRERSWAWGYLHIILFGSIIGVGAGLHVAAQVISGVADVDAAFALTCVTVPVLAFEIMILVLYTLLVGRFDPLHIWLFIGGVALLGLSVVAGSAGLSIGGSLLIVAASPLVLVVGYETVGYRHFAAVQEREDA
ncbi:low temperature requirement protein A [Microbacterium deminutum]|uniref:Low temperature requirement protein A n=2 Tax=Microbacterium deminutum TaxID=344164 RepID=A0ABN2Q8Y4_9MICO